MSSIKYSHCNATILIDNVFYLFFYDALVVWSKLSENVSILLSLIICHWKNFWVMIPKTGLNASYFSYKQDLHHTLHQASTHLFHHPMLSSNFWLLQILHGIQLLQDLHPFPYTPVLNIRKTVSRIFSTPGRMVPPGRSIGCWNIVHHILQKIKVFFAIAKDNINMCLTKNYVSDLNWKDGKIIKKLPGVSLKYSYQHAGSADLLFFLSSSIYLILLHWFYFTLFLFYLFHFIIPSLTIFTVVTSIPIATLIVVPITIININTFAIIIARWRGGTNTSSYRLWRPLFFVAVLGCMGWAEVSNYCYHHFVNFLLWAFYPIFYPT